MASPSIQTVPSSFTSAFSKPQPEYDVFLNFRGEDTRYNFTDHLYRALVDRKISTFRDDEELEMGKPISPKLLEAIEKSRIAVIIFSENYASSKWCLEELTKIDECRDRGILSVLPIFYHVDPSDVRSQKNTFAKDFVEQEKRFEENPTKVLKWKTALTNVASLSGRHLKDGYVIRSTCGPCSLLTILGIINLYHALDFNRIIMFKDDIELEIGKPISQELLDAIEKLRIADVIFSKDYAFSTWCLEELAKIVECKEKGILTVLPIFYHVEPTDVRHQSKTFAVDFLKHEERFQENPEVVEKWRVAIREVANIAGKHLGEGSSEVEFIRNIVEWISEFIYGTRSIFPEVGLVGIGSRVEEMKSYLGIKSSDDESKDESNDVRFIGICGMSGMGKTTLAKVVFDRICDKFDASSFLEDVRDTSKDTSGLEKLQDQLLRDMKLKSNGGLPKNIVISNRLRKKRVLIVVDDVSKQEQLEALVGKPDWFGPKSRIIITTEDKHLLVRYKIQVGFSEQEAKIVCNVKGLNNDDALQLFSLNAFPKPHCENDFLDLCKDFVNYAQGIPLVLKVLGSHLCTKTKKEWESTWNQLKEIPDEEITKKLRIAFDGLKTFEQELFLDIACFFKGEDRSRVADILESVCYSHNNIRNLIDKSLITIVGGKLWMHNLLQVMGWEIVREESNEPKRRSRLWLHDHVLDALKNNTGTNRIEGIVLKLPPNEEEELNADAESFSNMNKLRLLKISKVRLPCLSKLSNELCLLEWHDYPLKSLPRSFQPGKLVELIMHRSHIQQLPEEFRNLDKLKLIDLSKSECLTQTPDFTGFPNIERLIFQGCTSLHELHPSVGGLKKLILLNLSGCSKLKKFPEIGTDMPNLLELHLDGTSIEELPSSIKHLTGLTVLNLQDCKNLLSFPSAICSLTSLKILTLSGCKGQQRKQALPCTYLLNLICATLDLWTCCFSIAPYTELEPINLLFPNSFSGLSSLESLDLSDCNLLDGALPDDFSCLSSLQSLNLNKNNFTCLPDSISQLSKLKLLFLDHCSKLKSLSFLPLSTQFVSAQGCTSLKDYSNQVVVWTSGEAGFTLINCLSLGDDEGKIAEVSLLDIHFQPLWQRYMEEQIHRSEGFCNVLPQTEIPPWFSQQRSGSSVSVPLPAELFKDERWKGIALCVIFEVHKNSNEASPGQDSKCFHEFICRLDMDGGLKDCPLVYNVPKEKFHVGSYGLWLYISHARFKDRLDERSCISPLITTNSQDIEIKMCGVRILYEHNMVEFVRNLNEKALGNPNELRERHEKFIQNHMPNSPGPDDEAESSQSNGQSESDSRLKRELKLLLSRLYQVDYARNHWYDYIFPQIKIPPKWFTYQNFGPNVKLELPAHLHDDSTWLGFTVYALYTIEKHRAGFEKDSRIFLRFSGISEDQVPFAPYTAFPLARDVYDESSQRLLVFYIPRLLFQLSRCSHIAALFESNGPGVKVNMCGIRLVYEQDVNEFVQTLVKYMIECPEALHQSISLNLLDQIGSLQDCNHEKEYGCAPNPERRSYPMPMLLPSNEMIQEERTSGETFSNQVIAAGTSKDSGRPYIDLGIPLVNVQFGSNMSSASTSKNSPVGSTNFGIPSMNRQGGTGSKTSSTGTSKNSSRDRSISLGIPLFVDGQCGSNMSSSLESWFGPYLQDYYNRHGAFNHCFPQKEIPEWFCKQSTGFSVRISLPPYLYDDPDWMGFAFCAHFSFHKHPTLVRNHLDTGASHLICCLLKTNLGATSPLLPYLMREDEVLISLCQRAFIWVSFIPPGILSAQWSPCTWVEFFFLSDSPDVSPLNCGVNLLYQHNLQAFTRTMVQCLTSYIDYLYAIHTSCLQQEIFIRLPYSQDKLSGSYGYEKVYEGRYSRGEEIGESSVYKTGPLDFHPSTLYNFCFPPSKIQEWFSHQSHGNSVTIDLPSNLYNDNDLMGLILYASFSFHGNPDIILNYLVSGISQFLHCQFQTIVADVFDQIIICGAHSEAVVWLINLREFIWISYIPVEPLKEVLQHSSNIKATFVSDWPDVMVQKCALRLLYQHDQVQFKRELRHCNDLILEQREIVRKHTEDYEKKRNEQGGVDEKKIFSTSDFEVQLVPRYIDQSKTNETKTKLGKSDLLDFDQRRVYNFCFPLCEILEWFSLQSDEPPVTIPLPPNVFNDNTWMGLVLCASIAVEANPTTILDIQNSETTYNLICHLETNIECVEPLHVHHITEEDLKLLQQGGFIWLSYIPRGSFQESLNQCSQIEASVAIDFPGLVQKSGFHLLYKHDEIEFKETIRQCMALFSNEHEVVPEVIYQSETNETKTQLGKSDLLDFDQCRVYKSCFPLREIPEWFSHQSNEAPVTIPLPPNVYNDSNWMGLALCAYVAIEANLDAFLDIQNSETSYNLICHLETSVECAEPLHVHHITKEDLKLSQQGGFIWLSYIPRGSFRDSLNQCSWIEASVVIDFPGLVQKCGFHLLYKQDEVEFKETIRQCVTLFSNEDEVSTKISSSSKEDSQSESVEPANRKDKDKRVLEY